MVLHMLSQAGKAQDASFSVVEPHDPCDERQKKKRHVITYIQKYFIKKL